MQEAIAAGGSLSLLGFFATAYVIGFSGAIMPGPVTTITMAHTARRGVWAGPLVSAGHAVVEGTLVMALALGAAAFITSAPVTGTIAVVGALVLAWMGWGMLVESRTATQAAGSMGSTKSGMGPFMGGAVASATNPYWYIWWATVGVGYFTIARPWGALGVATFFLGHVLSDFTWLTLLAIGLTSGRNLFSDKVYRALLLVLGGFLIVMAAGFLLYGIKQVSGV